MKDKLKEIIILLTKREMFIHYDDGDFSDLGNEIGHIVGEVYPMMSEEQTKDFVHGIKHGISLTNGTH